MIAAHKIDGAVDVSPGAKWVRPKFSSRKSPKLQGLLIDGHQMQAGVIIDARNQQRAV
jgi:hypothetical protein